MRTILQLLLILLLILPASVMHGQDISINQDLRFDNYSSNNTFVNEFIGNVYRDKRGYVWGGANGLYRFDGKKYKQYTGNENKPYNLRNNYVVDLIEDSCNRLWVGNGGGLCYYSYSADNIHYLKLDEQHDINFAYYYTILKNDLWFVCNYGLCKVNLNTLKVTKTCIGNYQSIVSVNAINDNTLIVSNREDAYVYHINEDKYDVKYTLNNIGQGALIKCNGKYWGWYNNGSVFSLKNINDTPEIVTCTETYRTTSILKTPGITGDSMLWIGFENNGIALLNTRTRKLDYTFKHDIQNPFSIQTDEVLQLFVDKENLIWIATGTGISVLNINNQSINTRLTPEKYVRRIVEDKYDKGKVFISFAHHGLTKVDWNTKAVIKEYYSIRKDNIPYTIGSDILDMVQLGKTKWLLCKWQGLLVWDSEKGVEKYAEVNVSGKESGTYLRTIIPVDSNRFYITCTNGLLLYDLAKNKLEYVTHRNDSDNQSDHDMVSGVYDNANTLWVATANGLVKYDINTKAYNVFRISNKKDTLINAMYDVAMDNNGSILCANAQGLSIFNIKDLSFNAHTKFNNNTNVSCHAIIVRNGVAWMNSEIGLLSYDLKTRKTGVYVLPLTPHFSVERFGIVGNELTVHFRNAYSYFKPEKLLLQPLPSVPIIEQLVVNNNENGIAGNNVELRYDQNILNFSFTAFNFNDPAHIKFRYMLQGRDEEWNYADEQRSANYTKLPPGKYTFIVQAGNNVEWNTTSATLHFSILPPFWLTWWFRVLIIILFLAIVIGVAFLRIVQIKKREAGKTAVNKMVSELEMKVLRSQMNPHFIFNSLNSIQKFIWENKQEDASEYLSKFSRLMRSILDNSMHKYITLEQELATLTLYIELEHRRSNNKFDYRIAVDDKLDSAHTLVPPLILQPYVENAIWHGLLHKEGRGELKIHIAKHDDDTVQVIIEDSGVGRQATAQQKLQKQQGNISYGMNITEQRLQMTEYDGKRGKVMVEDLYNNDRTPAGTRVIIYLPIATFVKI